MNCPRCQRTNAPHRRYCGDCGTNLEPVCRACGFENEARDRYCGGCGNGLVQRADAAPAVIVEAPRAMTMSMPPPPPPPPKPVVAAPKSELDGLFAAPAAVNDGPKLPDANISQDDLDRLFGAVP